MIKETAYTYGPSDLMRLVEQDLIVRLNIKPDQLYFDYNTNQVKASAK